MSWEMKTDATRGHEGQPLVIGSIMYMVSAYPNNVFAIDLAAQDDGGKVLWKYTPQQDERAVAVACCDTVNRGASYADGKLVFGRLNGDVIALDARTGKEVWKQKLAHPDKGETITMAPIIADGKWLPASAATSPVCLVAWRPTTCPMANRHGPARRPAPTRRSAWARISTGPIRNMVSSAIWASRPFPTKNGSAAVALPGAGIATTRR
ncbi:outer membrane protein assembly factor BamB family protein [Xanthomonas vasicola]